MQRDIPLWMLLLACVLGGRSPAATIHVPADHSTIQQAIDAAQDGDVVLVADGVYMGLQNVALDFGGRLITLRSSGGPEHCIIDCGPTPQHRALYFHSGETAEAVVDGFTIRNAFVEAYDYGEHVVGGGIRIENSSPTIINCVIADNDVLTECCWAAGGGVYSSGGSPTLIGCSIVGNGAWTFDNVPSGGGIYHTGGFITLINCALNGNGTGSGWSDGKGGGASISGGLLVNCTFSGNRADDVGGGLRGGGLTAINCTFSGNRLSGDRDLPAGEGGGFSGSAELINCIFWGNTREGEPDQIDDYGPGVVTVSHSNVQGGWPGNGNIDADPLFANPSDDDLRLRHGSPSIDAGDGAAVPEGVDTDLAGSAREVDDQDTPDCQQAPGSCGGAPVVDMGALEYHLPCPWDLDYSGSVGDSDFEALLIAWGARSAGPPDVDGDGVVGIKDFLAMLAHWGPCCGPAGPGEPDCDGDGFADACNIDAGESADCNGNSTPDECDLAAGTSTDCDSDAVPDDCAFVDCNGNEVTDQCDLASATSRDCDGDAVPDECQSLGCDGCTDEAASLVASDGAAGDQFGCSVSVSGNRALVGARGANTPGLDSGAVYVFGFDGAAWVEEAKLAPAAANDHFGKSVHLDNGVAVIGGRGAAWVYRDGTAWLNEAVLVPAVPNHHYGTSVAIDDDVIVVGAPKNHTQGPDASAYVYRFNGTQWIEEAILSVPDAGYYDFFASSVSVSGDVILIGDIGDIFKGFPPGSAYVFRFNGAEWVLEAELTASDAAYNDQFGIGVSVRGNVAVVGAARGQYGNVGAWGSAYVFRYDGARWVEEAELTNPHLPPGGHLTASVSVSSDADIVGMGTTNPGAVFVFVFDGAQWSRQTTLSRSGAEPPNDNVAATVSLSGFTAFVGAPDAYIGAGSVYVYRSLADCNQNTQLDLCELLSGAAEDANDDGFPDKCGVDCNLNDVPDNQDIAGGESVDCNGNGVPDECDPDDCNDNFIADACDIASGFSTDFDGNGVPDECPLFPHPNDLCSDPGSIGEGVFPFTTVAAFTDGLSVSCSGGPGFAFVNDIWFLYTPSCIGTATFSVCNDADFDTRVAVYTAAPCPPSGGVFCSDNAPGCGTTSQVQVVVHPVLQYLVRVGGTSGPGFGTLTVTCQPLGP